MKVLIVGGTGVISTAVVKEAIKQGIKVTCINRGFNHGNSTCEDVETLHFDVRNRQLAEKKLSGRSFDVVVDFICAKASDAEYSLSLFKKLCKQYVFISTDSVYKLREDGHYDENCDQPNSEWDYSYMKSECEDVVKSICTASELHYTIVRPSITYGNTRIPYGFMPPVGYHYSIVKRIIAGKPIPIWNNGSNIQTLIRVEDFAVGMVGLWGNPNAMDNDFNISGEWVSWSDVLDVIDSYLGKKSIRVNIPLSWILQKLPERRGEFLIDRSVDHYVSNEKLKKIVPKFSVNCTLKDGVAKTIEYYESHNNIFGIDYRYDGLCDMIIQPFVENKLSFVSYDRSSDKYNYFIGRYYDNRTVKIYLKFLSLTKRVINKIRRILGNAINK